ncbi:hypothetical protein HDV00_005926 [Rhizophlyctis rosea]|nr:hypothetical protein HDV00_005926 [Rhizophlyctis rosea]
MEIVDAATSAIRNATATTASSTMASMKATPVVMSDAPITTLSSTLIKKKPKAPTNLLPTPIPLPTPVPSDAVRKDPAEVGGQMGEVVAMEVDGSAVATHGGLVGSREASSPQWDPVAADSIVKMSMDVDNPPPAVVKDKANERSDRQEGLPEPKKRRIAPTLISVD